MNAHKKHPDGNLPATLKDFDDAIYTLTAPQTRYINHHRVYAPSLYLQLADCVRGEQGTGNADIARSMPPFWCDAFDLLNEIDTAAQAWQPQPDGIPPTTGRFIALRARSWRPQDIRQIKQIITALQAWADRITTLLDPEHVKYVSAPCPACGKKTVYHNSAGESVRQPALQIVTNRGCVCQACGAQWGPELYMHLCRLLGFALPAGVLDDTKQNRILANRQNKRKVSDALDVSPKHDLAHSYIQRIEVRP